MLRATINDALKNAMKAKDQRATSTLRLILAALKDRDIAARGAGSCDPIPDEAILEMLQKMIKQRQESIEMYRKGNREDLVTQEQEEIAIIEGFLPKQMDEQETAQAVDAAIAAVGATSIKDMGKTIAALKKDYAGRMDFAKASGVVKRRLGAA
jgi:uncharacterized protein YqeY